MSAWMNQFEVAALLRVSVNTLSRWRRAGRGPQTHVRLKGSNIVLYLRSEVETFLAERMIDLQPAANG